MPNERFQKPRGDKKPFAKKGAGRPWRPKPPPRSHNPGPNAEPDDGPIRLFGLHAVEAALQNPRRQILRLVATENAVRRLTEQIGTLSIPIEPTSPRDLDRLLGPDTVHQGVMAEVEPLPEPEWTDLAQASDGRPLLVLDQVTDPHNVGAILRSAAVFGASGIVMTRRHSPPLNGVLAKSASGALETVPVARVANLAHTLGELKSAGFYIVGLDGASDDRIEDFQWNQPTALVLGSEGKGLRELTRKLCDASVRITTDGTLASLNVSNAAAVVLHVAAMARRK